MVIATELERSLRLANQTRKRVLASLCEAASTLQSADLETVGLNFIVRSGEHSVDHTFTDMQLTCYLTLLQRFQASYKPAGYLSKAEHTA